MSWLAPLAEEISERILEELDESTPWASSLKPDGFMNDKDDSEEQGARTVLIFDWDDTLLPTTACTADMRAEPSDEQRPALEAHAQLVSKTLRLASSIGRVGIVTLAASLGGS
ncbi:Ift81 [Symbiodinium natans]|uniref:Ift81 protein n=1 Tax=Symbiodinium natans TaxID=878477 RepID=A0A812GT05_9DINO|nr:Ift81 [Symbiodinium natans]